MGNAEKNKCWYTCSSTCAIQQKSTRIVFLIFSLSSSSDCNLLKATLISVVEPENKKVIGLMKSFICNPLIT